VGVCIPGAVSTVLSLHPSFQKLRLLSLDSILLGFYLVCLDSSTRPSHPCPTGLLLVWSVQSAFGPLSTKRYHTRLAHLRNCVGKKFQAARKCNPPAIFECSYPCYLARGLGCIVDQGRNQENATKWGRPCMSCGLIGKKNQGRMQVIDGCRCRLRHGIKKTKQDKVAQRLSELLFAIR